MRAAVRTVDSYRYDKPSLVRDVQVDLVGDEGRGINTHSYKLRIQDEEVTFTYYEWLAIVSMMEWMQK